MVVFVWGGRASHNCSFKESWRARIKGKGQSKLILQSVVLGLVFDSMTLDS